MPDERKPEPPQPDPSEMGAFAVDYPDAAASPAAEPFPETAEEHAPSADANVGAALQADAAALAVDYPDSAPPPAESLEEWSAPPRTAGRWRRRLGRLGRDPRTWFLLAMAIVFAWGWSLRCWRLDMPPLDNPAARQRSNLFAMESFVHNAPILAARTEFHEFQLYPWLAAKTFAPGQPDAGREIVSYGFIHCKLWTWARGWSVFWSLWMIAFAAVVGYWSVASARVGPVRRWTFALLAMAAVAFNPYHIALSRLTMTEPMTLAFQTMALAFFLLAMARPHRIAYHALFIVFFTLAGLAKIPSLVWLPVFAWGYLANRRISSFWKIAIVAAGLAGLAVVFWVYKLNPFTAVQTYAARYSSHAGQMQSWLFHELWYKSYFTRVAFMLTVPGMILAAVGLLVAPWTYRTTMLLLLAAFYFLNNLQSYNFSHMILPGMMLALFGANFIVEAGANRNLALGPRAQSPTPRRFLRLHQAYGLAIVLAIMSFMGLTPPHDLTAEPYGYYIQALNVIDRYVPKDAPINTNDQIFEYYAKSLSYRKRVNYKSQAQVADGAFYSFDRSTVAHDLAGAWVRWASLPGEYAALLLDNKPALMDEAEAAGYARLAKSGPALPGLDVEAVLLPKASLDSREKVVRVEPGKSVSIGIAWNNTGDAAAPGGYRLARLISRLDKWNQLYPPPIREGGAIRGSGDLLCIPAKGRQTVRYTFDFPKSMPAGQYALWFYPIAEEAAGGAQDSVTRWYGLPFVFEVVQSPEPTGAAIECRMIDLYPDTYLWEYLRPNRFDRFADWKLDSVVQAGNIVRILPCPGSPSGRYRLTLTGSGTPIYGNDNGKPKNLWPTVDVYLASRQDQPAATVVFASDRIRPFTAEFVADKPFDSVKFAIKTIVNSSGRTPFWLTDFDPSTTYGPEAHQSIRMGAVKLERVKGK